MKIRIAHSPDSDDAFMFYGLAKGKLDTGGLEVSHVLKDIESLNRDALQGTYEVTACSFHAYPYIADKYALMPCGGSIGDGYGPILVAKTGSKIVGGPGAKDLGRVAIPGTMTSAYLALRLYAPDVDTYVVPFDAVFAEVLSGRADCGLVIHEGQLTFGGEGLRKIVDLGEWWLKDTGLPLPMGGNAVRRDLGPEMMKQLTRLVRDTVKYSLANREAALEYAMTFARGMQTGIADRFVGMWVNDLTIETGERGREAIRTFLRRGREAGVITKDFTIDFVEA
jgi:1,4-dihydroxy-6-naphthoate synthase